MTGFDERMAALRDRFIARAADEAVEAERLIAAADWPGLRDLAHGLAGRAGMFGFPEVGERARQLEEAIDARIEPRLVCSLAAEMLSDLRLLAQVR